MTITRNKNIWKNNEAPALSAENLNKIENDLDNVVTKVNELSNKTENVKSALTVVIPDSSYTLPIDGGVLPFTIPFYGKGWKINADSSGGIKIGAGIDFVSVNLNIWFYLGGYNNSEQVWIHVKRNGVLIGSYIKTIRRETTPEVVDGKRDWNGFESISIAPILTSVKEGDLINVTVTRKNKNQDLHINNGNGTNYATNLTVIEI